MNIYCTYVTFYRGNKLPPFYIGSTSVERVINGYHGTVSSKQYKRIWVKEQKENPHLFLTKIISKHNTRQEALDKEHILQKSLNVVRSSMYINKSLATKNGMFGMDVSGTNNPNYGKSWDKEQVEIARKRSSDYFKDKSIIHIYNKELNENKMIEEYEFNHYETLGWAKGRLMETTNISKVQSKRMKLQNTIMCSCIVCKITNQALTINDHYKRHHDESYLGLNLEYFGKYYKSYKHLLEITKCSKRLYEKYYLNGIDPTPHFKSKE